MLRIFILLWVVTCATASEQVFRRIGPDGQVHFSDQPGADSKQINIPPPQTVRLRPLPKPTATEVVEPQTDMTAAYTEFSIVSPTADQGFRANDGNVPVRLLLQPKLVNGHAIVLSIDGEDGEATHTSESLTIELRGLSRGRHTVAAKVVDDEGNELVQTAPVSFNVLRVVATGGR